ncbi:MAG: LysR family transcriptional regulator [Polyangiales bacterium]
MESLASIESFVRSAEAGSFSAAARRLGVTPAAVSKNVAKLEGRLGVRLFQRTTRSLRLTEPGERFLRDASSSLGSLQSAMANLASTRQEPSGRLRVSVPIAFGCAYVVPLMPAFLAKYPAIELDMQFDNRQVDLVADGYDVALGGSLELGAGIVARELGRAHVVAVASPAYLSAHTPVRNPVDLQQHDGILLRSVLTGRLRNWPFRNSAGEEATLNLRPRAIFDDMEAIVVGARAGLGIGLAALSLALPSLDSGELVRVLPKWHADAGALSIYYASHTLLPHKTRAFVDFVVAHFKRERLAKRLRAD